MSVPPSRSPSNDSILLFSFGLLMLVVLGVLLLAACSTHESTHLMESTSEVESISPTASEWGAV